MAEKITIARIAHFTKDKEGNQLTTKAGKPYTRCLIDATDGRKMSGFGNQTTSNWNEGMEVDVEVTESNGYLNFSLPKRDNKLTEMAIKQEIGQWGQAINRKLDLIMEHLEIKDTKQEIEDIRNQEVPVSPFDGDLAGTNAGEETPPF